MWNNLPLVLALEIILVVIGFAFYLITVKPQMNLARYGIAELLLLITVLIVTGQLFADTSLPANTAAMSWILQPFLICGLAYWFDKKRLLNSLRAL